MKTTYFRVRVFSAIQKQEKGVIYFFSGFGSPLAYYLPAIRRFRKCGYRVVCFSFKTKAMLGLSVQTLPISIGEVVQTVNEFQQSQPNNKPAIAIGNSMGSVNALHVAAAVNGITGVVVNTGYALISKHIFEDKIGTSWRKKLIAQGYDQQSFYKAIVNSEPATVLPKLKGKKVLIFINKDDNVISPDNSQIYLDILDKHNIPYTFVQNSKMRHGTTILKNLMGKELVDFINRF